MAQRYSRLESTEERKNFRSAVVLLILTVAVIILLFLYGIPLVGKMASIVSGLKGNPNSISSNDKTAPVPPNFNIFPDYTNQQIVSITGTAEPGVSVKLNFNGRDQETLADREGNFIFQDISLREDVNTFFAIATDSAGNISQRTNEMTINYDTKPPEVTVDSPADGVSLFGSTQRQINIQGTTENTANVTINERVVSLNDAGKFQYPVTLNGGENIFNIKVTDLAGNITEKSITVNFSE